MNTLNNINNFLYLTLIMLIIFCICLYVYSNSHSNSHSNNIIYDTFNNVDNNIVDKNIELLDLINTATKNAQKHISNTLTKTHSQINKENFGVVYDENLLTYDDAIKVKLALNATSYLVDNNYSKNSSTIRNIEDKLIEFIKVNNLNKLSILQVLTNIYIIKYMEFINKSNAESYKTFLQYDNPYNNKYYKQYIK